MSVLKPRARWLLLIGAIVLLVISSVISTIFFDNSKEGSQGQRLHSQHELLGVDRGDALFIGDDLTAEGLWSELFPTIGARNRGLNGQTTSELLYRVIPLLQAAPKTVMVNIGANDAVQQIPVASSLANYRELINLIRSYSPESRIVFSSVLPLNRESAAAVVTLNEQLESLSSAHDLVYIDLADALLDANGHFKAELADRRMRLRGNGYALWRDLLTPHLTMP